MLADFVPSWLGELLEEALPAKEVGVDPVISLPLLFRYRKIIAGRQFFADVQAEGRALLTQEPDGGYWLSGVNPGGLSGGNPSDLKSALEEFRDSYFSVLFDLAHAEPSFERFKTEVEDFFYSTCEETLKEWEAAVATVRSDPEKFAGFPSQRAEGCPPRITVKLVKRDAVQPSLNQREEVIEKQAVNF